MSDPWGKPLEGSPQAGFGYPMPPNAFGPPRNSKLAIASLVLGILSVPLIVIGPIGVLVSLVGLVLGIVALVGARRRNQRRLFPVLGIVLSVIGLIGGSLITAAEVHAANSCKAYKSGTTQYNDCIKQNFKL